jgi:hypothetical protein
MPTETHYEIRIKENRVGMQNTDVIKMNKTKME